MRKISLISVTLIILLTTLAPKASATSLRLSGFVGQCDGSFDVVNHEPSVGSDLVLVVDVSSGANISDPGGDFRKSAVTRLANLLAADSINRNFEHAHSIDILYVGESVMKATEKPILFHTENIDTSLQLIDAQLNASQISGYTSEEQFNAHAGVLHAYHSAHRARVRDTQPGSVLPKHQQFRTQNILVISPFQNLLLDENEYVDYVDLLQTSLLSSQIAQNYFPDIHLLMMPSDNQQQNLLFWESSFVQPLINSNSISHVTAMGGDLDDLFLFIHNIGIEIVDVFDVMSKTKDFNNEYELSAGPALEQFIVLTSEPNYELSEFNAKQITKISDYITVVTVNPDLYRFDTINIKPIFLEDPARDLYNVYIFRSLPKFRVEFALSETAIIDGEYTELRIRALDLSQDGFILLPSTDLMSPFAIIDGDYSQPINFELDAERKLWIAQISSEWVVDNEGSALQLYLAEDNTLFGECSLLLTDLPMLSSFGLVANELTGKAEVNAVIENSTFANEVNLEVVVTQGEEEYALNKAIANDQSNYILELADINLAESFEVIAHLYGTSVHNLRVDQLYELRNKVEETNQFHPYIDRIVFEMQSVWNEHKFPNRSLLWLHISMWLFIPISLAITKAYQSLKILGKSRGGTYRKEALFQVTKRTYTSFILAFAFTVLFAALALSWAGLERVANFLGVITLLGSVIFALLRFFNVIPSIIAGRSLHFKSQNKKWSVENLLRFLVLCPPFSWFVMLVGLFFAYIYFWIGLIGHYLTQGM